jgi:hypothetical protein
MKSLLSSLPIAMLVGLLASTPTVYAETRDGETPAEETVCGGLEGNMFGICNAYCEAMDCDDPNHKASDTACLKKAQQWTAIAGETVLPCNEGAGISFTKEVNADDADEIPVEDPVIYTFTILNTGNIALYNLELEDASLSDALDDCVDNLPATLGINEEYTCSSDVGETVAEEGTIVNTATVTALSLYGSEVSAEATAVYTGVEEPEPPPLVTCSDIKTNTALSMVLMGVNGVDIATEGGQQFFNVQNGNQITFSTVGGGNDITLTLSGGASGSSVFHISCSDEEMNGSEDCGSNQGDGKGNDSNLINTWLFDGMTGVNGSFSCMLPNTGVVDPEP